MPIFNIFDQQSRFFWYNKIVEMQLLLYPQDVGVSGMFVSKLKMYAKDKIW